MAYIVVANIVMAYIVAVHILCSGYGLCSYGLGCHEGETRSVRPCVAHTSSSPSDACLCVHAGPEAFEEAMGVNKKGTGAKKERKRRMKMSDNLPSMPKQPGGYTVMAYTVMAYIWRQPSEHAGAAGRVYSYGLFLLWRI